MGLAEVRQAGVDDAAALGGLQLEFWRQTYADLLPAALHLRRAGATTGRYWAPVADEATAAFLTAVGWSPDGIRRVLDTGEGTLAEQSYSGTLDLVLV